MTSCDEQFGRATFDVCCTKAVRHFVLLTSLLNGLVNTWVPRSIQARNSGDAYHLG